MRSMTGYGRGQSSQNGSKFSVELNSVNRKQSDVVVALPRELAELEPRVRDVINAEVARGRLNVVIAAHYSAAKTQAVALDANLARTYFRAMVELQKELNAAGEINIETILRAPGVVRAPEEQLSADDAWPHVESALKEALADLVTMREREGKHLAKDLIRRLKTVRGCVRKIRLLQPGVLKRHRQSLHERIQKAGLELPIDDERLVKEVIFFADKSDISEELTRLDAGDLIRGGRQVHLRVHGKRDRIRDVPLPPNLVRRVERLIASRPVGRTSDAIFLSHRRRGLGDYDALTTGGVYQVVKEAVARAGMSKRVFPHLLRHSWMTEMLRCGMNPIQLSFIAGASTEVIAKNYAHLTRDDAYEAMIRALSGSPTAGGHR